MFISDITRQILNSIHVEVIQNKKSHDQIRISGIRGDLLASDLSFYFKTSRVGKYMFDKLTRNYVLFPSFFAFEVLRIMDTIIDARRKNYLSKRTAIQIKEGILANTWAGRLVSSDDYPKRLDLSRLTRFKYQPLADQRPLLDVVDKAKHQMGLNGVILDAIMGSGKTMMGLYVLECSKTDVKIVVTPKNAIDRVWHKTIEDDLNYRATVWRSDLGKQYQGEDYLLCHYEALGSLGPIVADLAKKGKSISIVVDECHNFNEIKSARSQLLVDVCQTSKSEFIVLQSGTPFKAIGAEIITALFCIDPTFDADIAERFKKIYAASASEALELLKHRLGFISYKISSIEISKPIIENVKIASPNGQKYTLEAVAAAMAAFVKERSEYYKSRKADDERVYNQILSDFANTNIKQRSDKEEFEEYKADVVFIRKGDLDAAKEAVVRANRYENTVIIPSLSREEARIFKEVKTIYKYVTLKIQGECLGRVLGRSRMECSVELAKSINYDRFIQSTAKKTLVYTVYVQALEQAAQTLKEKEYTPLVVYGETNKNLNSIIKDFEINPQLNPLVATFHSLSTAIPLVMADVMLMIDTPFRDYIFQQTVARINRRGTTTQTYVYIAGLDTGELPNLSTRTIDILKWSQSQVEKITGVSSPFEIDEKKISVEALSMAGEAMQDADFLELQFEEAFMSALE